jgi:amino acid adenylation domain-containing protein
MTGMSAIQRFPGVVPQLHDLLSGSAGRLPDKVALTCADQTVTYGELDRRSNALAHALCRRGVSRGDRVVLFSANTIEMAVAFWAALKANAVVSPVSPLTKSEKLAYLLGDCQPRVLLTEASCAEAFVPVLDRASSLASVLVSGDLQASRAAGARRVEAWGDAVADAPADVPPPRQGIDVDLAAIIYTSGSAGDPKGVMLTHRNMLTAAAAISAYLEMRQDDVVLCALPLSFDYGLYQLILTAAVGGRVVLERGFAFPTKVLEAMARERVTVFPGVPPLLAVLREMKTLRDYDLSSIRCVTNTGAALEPKHIDFVRSAFPQARVYSMYGLTECKRCTYLPPEDIERKPGSVGIAIPNTEIWITNDDGMRLGPNEVGQLVVRGATVMRGYWGKPEATASKLKPGPLPGEVVLYTGDLCRMDEEGYLYFVGRMDEVVKSGAEKVAPREVERALESIPGVREAAVIGVPDPVLGQALKAYVIPAPNASLSEKALQRECRRLLEAHMVPRHIVIVADLPRTSTGKVSKKELT